MVVSGAAAESLQHNSADQLHATVFQWTLDIVV